MRISIENHLLRRTLWILKTNFTLIDSISDCQRLYFVSSDKESLFMTCNWLQDLYFGLVIYIPTYKAKKLIICLA